MIETLKIAGNGTRDLVAKVPFIILSIILNKHYQILVINTVSVTSWNNNYSTSYLLFIDVIVLFIDVIVLFIDVIVLLL